MPRKTYRKIITSPETLGKINPQNIELMEKFLKDKGIRVSEKTITVYRSNLNIFFTWNYEHNDNKPFVEIRKIEFSEFFSYVASELKIGSARINNLRSTLSSISHFVEKFYDDLYPHFRNVILNVIDSSPKEERREKTILSDEQIENLLLHLQSPDSQKACWLALAITCGARFSELLHFEIDLIDENRTAFGDLFLETTRPIKTKGRGKSGKMLYKYILRDKFLPYYKTWLEERQKILAEKGIQHNFLFIKQNGKPATPSTIRTWIPEFERFLGIPFYTHALRHYLTTLLSKKNIPYVFIQELFGWSNLEMVTLYDDSTIKDREVPELQNLRGAII